MVKGGPTKMPFGQRVGYFRDFETKPAPASNRRLGKFLGDADDHSRDLGEGKIGMNEYGAKRREAINAFHAGKAPYAFKPKKD